MIKPFLYCLAFLIMFGAGESAIAATGSAGSANPITDPNALSGNSQTSIADIAQSATSNAQNANDDAHIVLTELFTPNWDNLFSGQQTAGPSTVLFEIFGYMNAATLVAVSILMFYVLTVGIIGTAHEGEALGKRYSTLWTPIRSVSSIAMLMPLPGAGGISLLQALLLMCISVGSNSANYIWGSVIDYIGNNGGSLVVSMPINYSTQTRELAAGILQIEVAQNYVYQSAYELGQNPSTNIVVPPQTTGTPGSWSSLKSGMAKFFNSTFVSGAFTNTIDIEFASPVPALNGKFGKISIICDPQYKDMCNAQIAAINQLISDLNQIAMPIGQRTYDAGNPIDPATFQNAISAFNTTIFNAAKDVANNDNGNFQSNYQTFAAAAKQKGWIEAGSWYWTLSGMQERIQKTVDTPPKLKPLSLNDIMAQGHSDINDVLAVMVNYQRKADIDTDAAVIAGSDDDGVWGNVERHINHIMLWLPNTVVDGMTKGDPVANMKSIGVGAINTMTTLAGVGFVANKAWDIVGKKNPAGMLASEAVEAATKDKDKGLNPMIMFLSLLALPIFGFFVYIAYYLPSIPFIMWMTGVVSWLILVMETVVVAPLWAAAHAIPEGEGFAGQHGKQGYMLFMGVLMRPPLMIAGFFISMFLIKGVSWLVGNGLKTYFDSSTASEIVGPVGMISMVIIGLTIIIKLAHKCFDLITWMPDNALKWIGSGAASLGESGQTSHISGVMVGAVNQAIQGLGGKGSGGIMSGLTGRGGGKGGAPSMEDVIGKAIKDHLGTGESGENLSNPNAIEKIAGGDHSHGVGQTAANEAASMSDAIISGLGYKGAIGEKTTKSAELANQEASGI